MIAYHHMTSPVCEKVDRIYLRLAESCVPVLLPICFSDREATISPWWRLTTALYIIGLWTLCSKGFISSEENRVRKPIKWKGHLSFPRWSVLYTKMAALQSNHSFGPQQIRVVKYASIILFFQKDCFWKVSPQQQLALAAVTHPWPKPLEAPGPSAGVPQVDRWCRVGGQWATPNKAYSRFSGTDDKFV